MPSNCRFPGVRRRWIERLARLCSYPFADISSLALRHQAKVLAILMKACFDRGLPSGKRPQTEGEPCRERPLPIF
ncbi:hypothetical protein RHECIAT_CH0001595 [Rhizobium etli CIAT 652]|uniref:Uncharacterized protein n=1 Tax=Rhizobium etli (strain CIAT 652) TaxID=491916 RepID=B3PVD2_RHIE6|nr:hypothetical protein RHECIAT_CH0001595 [Rhizobium etli CIAT 652]KKZ87147.1 hypothetical protein RPHASCH2410_CH14520 [Rhizobium phaseoli Ch24-10]